MTEPLDPAPAESIEAYLDSSLRGESRVAFERRLATEADLRRALEAQQGIDAALRRQFARAQPLRVPPAVLARFEPRPASGLFTLRRVAAIAAALVIVAGGSWLGWSWWSDPVRRVFPDLDRAAAPAETLYASIVSDGMEPEWVCRDNQEFHDYFKDKLKRGLVLRTLPSQAAPAPPSPPEGVEVLGLSSASLISRYNAVLLARVRGEPVLVIAGGDFMHRPPELPQGSPLHLSKRVVNEIVLYELSPRPQPALLDLFEAPMVDDRGRVQPPAQAPPRPRGPVPAAGDPSGG